MQYNEHAGVLYDSLIILTEIHENSFSENEPHTNNNYINIIKKDLSKSDISIQEYLSLFFHGTPFNPSFIQTVLFNQFNYDQCTLKKAQQVIGNISYLKRRFIEYYFPDLQPGQHKEIADLAFPNTIDVLLNSVCSEREKTYLLHTLICFEQITKQIINLIEKTYAIVLEQHRSYIVKHKEDLQFLKQSDTIEKLKTISHATAKNSDLQFTISLLDDELIKFRSENPNFYLLGIDYERILKLKYQYCNVNPLSFAQALGNDAKRSIYQALIEYSVLTTGEMERKLHLSRNAVAQNVKEMRECGIISIFKKVGLTHHYIINPDYLGIVLGGLNEIYINRKQVSQLG